MSAHTLVYIVAGKGDFEKGVDGEIPGAVLEDSRSSRERGVKINNARKRYAGLPV
jgi:hypothetical protein